MTLLLVIGDIHGQYADLERVLAHVPLDRVKAVLLTGDLGFDQKDLLLPSAMRTVEIVASRGKPVVFVPGNHDLAELPDLPGAYNADDRAVDVAGLRIRGVGGSGPALFGFPYEWSEDDIRKRQRFEAEILLSHTPPLQSGLDRCFHGAHGGSAAVREMLSPAGGNAPWILVCGHIHEAVGAKVVDGTPCYNAGSLGSPFGRAQYGLVELDWEPSTRRVDRMPRPGMTITHRHLDGHAEREWTFEAG
jgi:uncharacterized protein